MPWWMKKVFLAPEGEGGGAAQQQQGKEGQPPPPVQTDAGKTDPPPVEVTTATGKVLPMTKVTIENLKRQERERGKKDASKDVEAKLKQAGFTSLDEALKAATERKAAPEKPRETRNGGGSAPRTQERGNGKPKTDPPPPQQQTSDRQERRERERQAKLEAERQERIRAQRKANEATDRAHALEAEYELKMLATRVGIKDPDYAVTLFVRECQGKSQEDLDKMDEQKFFEGLKETRPHLFAEPVKPANTGTEAGGNAPPPPGAGKVKTAAAQAGQFDARKATKEELAAEYKRRGLKYPVGG